MKSRWALVLILCLQGFTCNDGGAEPGASIEQAGGEAPEEAQAPRRARVSPAPAVAPAPDGTAAYEDLLALLHLADVYDPAGLFIDFGTAARLKYTIGNWNSGWQGESREGDASVSTFGKTARLYLPAASKQPMQLRFRAKPYATGALIVYVNGKTVGEARFAQGDGFREFVNSDFRRGPSRWREFDHAACDEDRPGARQGAVARDGLAALRARFCREHDSASAIAGRANFGGRGSQARDCASAWRAGRLVRRSAGRRRAGLRVRPQLPRRRRAGVADRQRRLGWLDSAARRRAVLERSTGLAEGPRWQNRALALPKRGSHRARPQRCTGRAALGGEW